jgi:hypothetical protein
LLWQPHIGNHRLTIAWIKYQTTTGLNSKLADGNHVLMWDFDGYGYDIVKDGLLHCQEQYKLSNIYLFGSTPPDHYLALCLYRHPWIQAVHIITSIPIIDRKWLRGAVAREYFTIRTGIKNGHAPEPLEVFPSWRHDNVKIKELQYWDRYETAR